MCNGGDKVESTLSIHRTERREALENLWFEDPECEGVCTDGMWFFRKRKALGSAPSVLFGKCANSYRGKSLKIHQRLNHGYLWLMAS